MRSGVKKSPQATQAAGVTGPRKRREENGKKYQKMDDFP